MNMQIEEALKLIQEHIDMQQYNHAWDKCQELIEALEQPANHSEHNLHMVQERNFCSRCGKRASKDLNHIHTCTPPQD